ncbi:MAG: 30S ribosome-binding factor RbfA [Planctomycetaceae bacterium]|nr:30S ribosome-binding factor RbfA [Planctomycetaceae bacterium]
MSTRRNAKIAQAIRQVVSTVILFELRDPRIQHVTVLGTEVAEDLRSAKVFVSVMGTDTAQRLALQGLNAARGFIQSRIADELKLRQTPILEFALDQGIKRSIEVSKTLREAMSQSALPADSLNDADAELEDDLSGSDEDETP